MWINPQSYRAGRKARKKRLHHRFRTAQFKRDTRVVRGNSKNLKYRLSYECPMLAFQYTRLKEQEQTDIWESEDWWLTEKENGVRIWLLQTQ